MDDHHYSLLEMLRYKRPEGSVTQGIFCEKFLKPLFGEPDAHGNYIKLINYPNGGLPYLCFTAHHDTVHLTGGMQHVVVSGDKAKSVDSNCLGADCTTGVWLILEMIKEEIPGIYVIHAGEEVGCKGSRALIKDSPDWLRHTKAVISFDRKGEESIITHQMGLRTASDEFAISLGEALNMPLLRPDDSGAYTDSNEYVDDVGECTNLSVGYLAQHTKNESQDIYFAYYLLEKIKEADWSKLVFKRQPGEVDYSYYGAYKSRDWASTYRYGDDYYGDGYDGIRKTQSSSVLNLRGELRNNNEKDLHDIIQDYPWELAELLDEWGIDAGFVMEKLEEMLYLGYTSPLEVGK